MSPDINRRDFLRLAGLLPLSLVAQPWTRQLSAAAGQQNVIILVFDASSAHHLSLHGYQRETMPNLTRLAERAIVYHNHYAGSSFTTSGTASLLTGTLPWTHRAIDGAGGVAPALARHNIFDLFSDYYRLGYSHNSWAVALLTQFQSALDQLVPRRKLYLGGANLSVVGLFPSDDDIATVGWNRFSEPDQGHAYSLFLSRVQPQLEKRSRDRYAEAFPIGMPMTGAKEPFLLEDAVKWFRAEVPRLPQPFLTYLHFLPPHGPYHPSQQYYGRFAHDGVQFPEKPISIFHETPIPRNQPEKRETYDEFMLYADEAFAELYKALETSGLLDNTWLVLTSDHGEMFERGLVAHSGMALYEPIVRVPLLIFEPGRRERLDIHNVTSAVDVLPTLAHVTGHAGPPWTEGTVLPPFGSLDAARSVFAMRTPQGDPRLAFSMLSTILIKGKYKLHYYFGYPQLQGSELVLLYDVHADPGEMNDLAAVEKDVAAGMLAEVKAKLAKVNVSYE